MPPTLIFRTKRINHGQQRRPWHCRACVSLRVTRAQSPAKSPTLPVGAGISRSWQFSPCPSRKALLVARLTRRGQRLHQASSGRSSGVEHNLAKVGVEGSNPFARSRFPSKIRCLWRPSGRHSCLCAVSIPPVYHGDVANIFWGKPSPEPERLRRLRLPLQRGHPATPREAERG